MSGPKLNKEALLMYEKEYTKAFDEMCDLLNEDRTLEIEMLIAQIAHATATSKVALSEIDFLRKELGKVTSQLCSSK